MAEEMAAKQAMLFMGAMRDKIAIRLLRAGVSYDDAPDVAWELVIMFIEDMQKIGGDYPESSR